MLVSLFNAVFRPGKGVLRRTWRRRGGGPVKVEYDLTDGEQQDYPQLLVPQRGTTILMPQSGKNCKRGPGELWLALWIKAHGVKGFYDNLAMRVDGHRYEPDLAYIDEERGVFIDIENDEPYTMGKCIPTHIIGKDDLRNGLVRGAGWIVLRFSERQCISTPARVVSTVMHVVRSIAPDVEIPKALQKVPPVEPDPRWDEKQARQYVKTRHRDSYLEKHLPFYCITNLFFKH